MSTVASYPSGLTWTEFLALPHELRNVALIDGEVVVNPPSAQHELVVRNLGLLFVPWIRAGSGRGEVSTQQPVKIHDHRGYQPDFAWYPQDRCAPPDEPRSFRGLPELIVEVLSPSTRAFNLVRKRRDYERIGIGEVWFIDTETRGMLACQRTGPGSSFTDVELTADDVITSALLDGFEIVVADLFEV